MSVELFITNLDFLTKLQAVFNLDDFILNFKATRINVQTKIRPCRGKFFLKINKRACTSIQYTRVDIIHWIEQIVCILWQGHKIWKKSSTFLTSLINVITEWKILSFIFLARIYQLYLIFHGDTLNSGQPQIHSLFWYPVRLWTWSDLKSGKWRLCLNPRYLSNVIPGV